jgi:glutamine amidotransferase
MIAIIDYKAGNLVSVRLALEDLGVPVEITRDPARIAAAERVIFPGVGAAGSAMAHLREMNLLDAVRDAAGSKPFLGICLGMQILFERSEENDGTECMGLMPGAVRKFQPADPLCKVPQMGWNTVRQQRAHPVLDGIEDDSEFYFVHSYYPDPSDPAVVVGATEYAGATFGAVVGRGNLVATQFHPERSGRIGLRLLDNFSKWDGSC